MRRHRYLIRYNYITELRLQCLDTYVRQKLDGNGVHGFNNGRYLERMFPELNRKQRGTLLSYYMTYCLPPGYVYETTWCYSGRRGYRVYRRGEDA